MMRLSLVLLSVCLLAACTSQPRTRYDNDLASCRRNADDTLGPASIDPGTEHNPSPMALADREHLRGQYDSMVDHCMKELPPFTDAPSKEDAPK